MGSLTSRPDIPRVQQQPVIVTIPQTPVQTYTPPPAETAAPQQTAPSTPQTVTDNNTTPAEGIGNEEAQRLVREDNLLRRSRGRLGTVLTGLNGLLSQTVAPSVRKTLLGE